MTEEHMGTRRTRLGAIILVLGAVTAVTAFRSGLPMTGALALLFLLFAELAVMTSDARWLRPLGRIPGFASVESWEPVAGFVALLAIALGIGASVEAGWGATLAFATVLVVGGLFTLAAVRAARGRRF